MRHRVVTRAFRPAIISDIGLLFACCFSKDSSKIPCIFLVEHEEKTGGATNKEAVDGVAQSVRRMAVHT
jgi:hypothetical protein